MKKKPAKKRAINKSTSRRKAEDQSEITLLKRQLKIEEALERVRARTMAMRNNSELVETSEVLYKQLIDLGIEADRILIGFPDEASGELEFWMTKQGQPEIERKFFISLKEPYVI